MITDGLKMVQQFPVKVDYDGVIVGESVADTLVEDRLLVELIAVPELSSHCPGAQLSACDRYGALAPDHYWKIPPPDPSSSPLTRLEGYQIINHSSTLSRPSLFIPGE